MELRWKSSHCGDRKQKLENNGRQVASDLKRYL